LSYRGGLVVEVQRGKPRRNTEAGLNVLGSFSTEARRF
jgi:hypothetical protein